MTAIKNTFWFLWSPWYCLFTGMLFEKGNSGHTAGFCQALLIFMCLISFGVQVIALVVGLAIFGIIKFAS